MAFTVTKVFNMSVGSKRTATFNITADGAEANISASTLGMKYIDFFNTGFQSGATGFFTIKANQDSSGVAANGGIGVSGAASGDQFYLTVYGR